MALEIAVCPVTPFQQNTSLIKCTTTGLGALVDPGGERERLLEAVDKMEMRVAKILVTHPHIDHVGAVSELAEHFDVPIEGPHEADRFWIDMLPQQGAMFGFPEVPPFEPQRWLVEGDVVELGDLRLEVLHCPGHTPGHVVFFERGEGVAFVGDVIFQGSVGRTDFPQGNAQHLIASIKNKLLPLGDDVRFVPGHGPMSTFGQERKFNPFVQ